MSDEKSQQQTSTESTVAGAAKTGKAISNIAKGAAAGGAHGAAIEAGKSSAKWLIPLIAAVLLPLILVAMLPSIIFGSLLGDGTDSPNGISNDEVLVQNMTAINEGISFILSEGLTDVLERIDSDFASSGCDGKEINNPFGADVVFNANTMHISLFPQMGIILALWLGGRVFSSMLAKGSMSISIFSVSQKNAFRLSWVNRSESTAVA